MPKINRIRIINFYFNNDVRNIADETFSFYGGENALLNLANGGGKSVLVQLMLQPVIPDLKLQNRSMSSYFKRSTYPAFIIIEWLLDNDSKMDYLMTGISIAPKSSTDENAGTGLIIIRLPVIMMLLVILTWKCYPLSELMVIIK